MENVLLLEYSTKCREVLRTPMFSKITLQAFPKEREERLRAIYRFSMFEKMMYRSNLWMHTQRVFWLLEEVLPLAKAHMRIDMEKARALALVHDDAEMITGDVQAGHKARMSPAELEKVAQAEEEAVITLSKQFPKKIHGYFYKDLLLHSLRKDCVEAQLVSYVDKIDALCESVHEIYAGNIALLRAVMFYIHTLTLFPKKFPALADFLASKKSSLTYIMDVHRPDKAEARYYTHLNAPHRKESIKVETDFPFYNTWRNVVIKRGGTEGVAWLIEQREG